MTSQEQGQLRSDAEAMVKSAAWLARRTELILANIRDGRLETVGTDCLAGAIELKRLERDLEHIGLKAGITPSRWAHEVPR
ncbi:MAG: hypothetical protein K2X84_15965 [Beijerinckiaceae bacterium]|nr:hypothetical protein [Beijerinckiaceae bacterium]